MYIGSALTYIIVFDDSFLNCIFFLALFPFFIIIVIIIINFMFALWLSIDAVCISWKCCVLLLFSCHNSGVGKSFPPFFLTGLLPWLPIVHCNYVLNIFIVRGLYNIIKTMYSNTNKNGMGLLGPYFLQHIRSFVKLF